MAELYVQPHLSQYGYDRSVRTRKSGCVWTSGANGVAAMSGGHYRPTPDDILGLLRPSEETNPLTPGWTLDDLHKALSRYGVLGFDIRSGTGRDGVLHELAQDRYIVIQGDSDQFPSGCSGTFDGDHCIGWHPNHRWVSGHRQWWIDDPICPEGRWEYEWVLWRYAEKFDPRIHFASFRTPVPAINVTMPDTSTGDIIVPEFTSAGGLTLASTHVIDLKAGTPLRSDPTKVATTLSQDATVDYMGQSGGFLVVRIRSVAFYPDSVLRETLALVAKGDAPDPRPKTPAELAATARKFGGLTQDDVNAAVKAANDQLAVLKAQVASLTGQVQTAAATERERIAAAEAARIRGL